MQKYARTTILSIFFLILLDTISVGQAQQKIPDFKLGSSTSDSTSNYLSSVFDREIPDSVQIVALGEVSHGTYGPIAFKVSMIKYLIEKKSYRKILFEQSEIAGIRTMRNYLNNQNSSDTSYISKWVKNAHFTQAVAVAYLDLFKWIKNYNFKHPKDMVEVAGFEVGTEKNVIDFVLNSYIIPFDIKESQKVVCKFNQNISDAGKIELLNQWFISNEPKLKARLDKQSFRWLHFYVRNAVNGLKYLIKSSGDTSKNPKRSNLFRDSLLAENVRYLSGEEKSIVSAHNAHIIRTEWKYMGTYLQQFFKSKYYVIATDFSKLATAEVVDARSSKLNKPTYVNLVFKSKTTTAANQIRTNFRILKGIFFNRNLIKMKTGNATNIIDAYGVHELAPSSTGALDALVVFDNILPNNTAGNQLNSP